MTIGEPVTVAYRFTMIYEAFVGVEQLVARLAHNQKVAGSSPAPATNHSQHPIAIPNS